MLRNACMVLCIGILASSCVAYSLQPSAAPPTAATVPPPLLPPSVASAASSRPRTPCTFDANKVVDLAITNPPFDASKFAVCGLQGCNAAAPVAGGVSAYASMIASAINNAGSARLRDDLCTLDKIYIDTDQASPNSDAWGMRELQNGNIRHIGIRVHLLSQLQALSGPLAGYESGILQLLLPPSQFSTNTQQWLNGFYYNKASPDTPNPPNTAILAILAHEMGHILWVSTVQDMSKGCTDSDPIVHKKRFFSYSWPVRGLKFGFHTFGNIEYGNRPRRSKSILGVRHFLANDMLHKAEDDLRSIYGGDWASLFATVAVDEDFVETYTLWTLKNGQQPLTSLEITMPSSTNANVPVNVVSHLNNPSTILYKKARWVEKCS
jgi:hypothetical protein